MSRLPLPSHRWLAIALLLVPSVARAHIGFRSSEPAKGATLTQAPRRILLRFSGRPEPALSQIRLTGPRGDISLAAVVADSTNGLAAAVLSPLGSGEYTVHWRAASSDGHVATGIFTFTFAAPAIAGSTTSTASPAATHTEPHVASPEAHEGHTRYEWMRWFDFAALIVVIGALAFRNAVLPALAARGVAASEAAARTRTIAIIAVLVSVVAALYRLYAESVAVHGVDRALDTPLVAAMLAQTTWGAGWLLGAAGVLATLAGWLVTARRMLIGAPLTLAGTLAMAIAPGVSGHAMSGTSSLLGVIADALHVLAAGGWTGGLFVLLVAGVPAMRRVGGDVHASIGALVNSYHPMALLCGPLVVASGTVSAWLRLGRVEALWQTGYGQTLLWKLALFACVAIVGAYNAMRSRRALGSETGSRRLRRAATIELVLVALVIVATTVLVVTPFPAEAAAP